MARARPTPVDKFLEIFSADFDAGRLYSRVHRGANIKPGTEIKGFKTSTGYLMVIVGGVRYMKHRIIYALKHGHAPEVVDHINRNKADNSISNLREVSFKQNSENTSIRKRANGLPRGVHVNRYGKFVAQLGSEGKRYNAPSRDTIDEAVADYKALAAKYHTCNEVTNGSL